MSEQCTYVRESRPEIAALNMGTMNYSKYSEKRKAFVFDMVFPNTYGKIIKLLSAMNEARREAGARVLRHRAHRRASRRSSTWASSSRRSSSRSSSNVLGGIPPTVESLQLQKKIALDLAPGSEWEVIGISKCQWRMLATALVLGGNVRVGLEDNFYLPDGTTMAKRNGELVEVAVRMVRDVGRKPATVERGAARSSASPASA